jgi:hypothetical protein
MRAIVPVDQLPAAISVQQGRAAAVGLAGPPVGGALFGIGRAIPFVADALSYTFSFVSLVLTRAPFQEPREPAPRTPLRAQLTEGFRFLWREPFLRVTSFLYGLGNFSIPGMLFVLVVVARHDGLSGTRIGLLAAFACLLAGASISPFVRRRLSMRAIVPVACGWSRTAVRTSTSCSRHVASGTGAPDHRPVVSHDASRHA